MRGKGDPYDKMKKISIYDEPFEQSFHNQTFTLSIVKHVSQPKKIHTQ